MNNIQKSFKKKSELRCMADGGVVDHMSGKGREQQMKESMGEWKAASAPPAGAPDFRNVQARVDTTYGQKPKSALQRLFGMADGGKPPHPATEYDFATGHGGDIKGPGGPTDDKVGPVMLSNKEYVLPADTVEAIGVDKLDALRAATHDFEETNDAVGLAGGGFFDDVTQRAKDAFSALRGPAPSPAAPAAPAPMRVNPGAGVSPRTPVGTGMMANTPPGQSMTPYQAPGAPAPAAKPGLGSRAGGLLRGTAALAPLAGIGDYKANTGGVDGSPVSYLAKGEFGNAGTAVSAAAGELITGGLRGVAKTADGVAGMFGANPGLTEMADRNITGGYFSLKNPDFSNVQGSSGPTVQNGAAATTPRGGLPNASGMPNSAITGADPNSFYAGQKDDAVIGTFNGRAITKGESDRRAGSLQTASFMPKQSEGDPAMAEIRSALRGIGGGGGGNWAPASNAKEINERYDSLMRGGAGQNRVKGSDWSQRHGLDVEMARAKELGADASNQSALRGQNMSAGAAADQTRMSGINEMLKLQAEREKAGAAGNAAATKAQQDAIKQAADANQQGYENFTKNVSSMFPDADPTVSATKQQEFMDFVSATDPEFLKKEAGVSSIKDLFGLGPQEQMAATQKLKVMVEMQQARNKSVGEGTMLNNGPQQTGFDAPVGGLRDAAWGDVANSNLGLGQYLYSNLPFTDNRVQELASGSVVPYDELVGNSADREKARKSNLRNP